MSRPGRAGSGMMALVLLVTAIGLGVFYSTEVGQTAFLDQQVEQARAAGRRSRRRSGPSMQKMASYMGLITAGSTLVMAPIMWLIVTGILFAVFNAALGGTATFKQLFAVFVHSTAVTVVQTAVRDAAELRARER